MTLVRGHHGLLLAAGGGGGGPGVTWNPLDKSANVNLSGGNLTAQCATASHSVVRATLGRDTGKWYYEVLAVAVHTSGTLNYIVGVADSAHALNVLLGTTNQSVGWRRSGGTISSGAASGAATYANGDVLGIAYDHSLRMMHCYRNNSLVDSRAYGGTATTVYPAMSFNSSTSQNGVARFKAADFTYSPPLGYSPWE